MKQWLIVFVACNLALAPVAYVVERALNAAPPQNFAVPKPSNWTRMQIEGPLLVKELPNAWAGGYKKLVVVGEANVHHELAFAADDDYREAERHVGLLVVVRGVEFRRGSDVWFAVESVSLGNQR